MNNVSILADAARAAVLVVLTSCLSAPAQAQPGEVAGWVEPDAKTLVVPTSAFRLDRAGKTIPYPDAGLQACDRLKLLDDKTVVRIRLASNLRMQLDAETPGLQLEIPCSERSIAASLAAALRAMIGGAEQRKQRVAALTRDVAPLSLPALLAAPQTRIAAGRRALYVAWTGGVGPYSVQVLRAGDGREVVSRSSIGAHSVVLPPADIEPGEYTLWVRNRAGHRVEGFREDGIVAVAPGAVPAMPEVLKTTGLTDEARALFYADYLAAQDEGRWTLEALQRVAALPAQSPAVRQWLLRYGGRD
jgi:hypothetical protein